MMFGVQVWGVPLRIMLQVVMLVFRVGHMHVDSTGGGLVPLVVALRASGATNFNAKDDSCDGSSA